MTEPWSNQAVSLIVIEAGGGFTGLFVYSGAPAAGNLIASIAPAAGTDPSGNSYLPGVTSYDVGVPFSFAASLFGGQVKFFTAPVNSEGPWTDQTVGLTIAQIAAGVWAPQIVSASGLLSLGGSPIGVTLPWVATNPSSGTVPETEHAFSFLNSWTQAAGRKTTIFKLTALGDLAVIGSVVVPVGFATGQSIASAIPAAWRPTVTQSLGAWDLTTNLSVRLAMTSAGVLQFVGPVGSTAAGHTLDITPEQVLSTSA